MAKSISTNFSLRLADKSKPVLIGDQKVSSAINSDNFYSTTYTVDEVGTYLGEIKEFLAVQCQNPILIEFQRVDMERPNQIYCSNLFINHGDFGHVWLRIPREARASIATVWYSTDAKLIPQNEYVKALKEGSEKVYTLALKNLNGRSLGIPLSIGNSFKSLDEQDNKIKAYTHNGEVKSLPVHTYSK
jgi:hypothetical protein